MNTDHELTRSSTTWSDAAVTGLLGGVVAGALMAIVLIVAGLTGGETPAAVLAKFDPARGASPLSGVLTHVAVSGVYGMLFGVIWHLFSRRRHAPPGWLAGLVYGGLLLAIAEMAFVAMPSALRDIPFAQFAVAHVLYGLVLGLLAAHAGRPA